ncbi:MAG: hypothetical protein JXB19_09635, partial [Bacteroidales bacterium]|nr:hypothetical protein [Bacteroidales bacterium]
MFYTKKIYRILIKVLLTAVILFILTSAVISFFYEKAVIRYLKSYLDEHLRTQITVDDIHFRLLKGFPNASIELRNIVVLSGENFSASDFTAIDADTLLEAKRLTFQFDFIKLLRSNYELKQINIARGHVNILFDKNNRNNLSVWKKNSKNSAQDDYNFDLSSIHLNDVDVNIITASGKFSFLSNSNRLVLKGSFGASMASIEAKGNLKVNSISSGNRTLIRNANMQLQTKSHYSNGQIKLEESRLLLNNLPLSFSGTVIPERENCQVNMLIAVSGFKIEDLMSLFSDDITGIPDQFNIDGNGSLMISLSGNPLLHGRLATNITFEFTKCTVTSERKKSAISDINMKGIASGNLIDRFFIQIDRFDASIGTGQISATVYTSAQNQKSASLHVNSTIKLNNLFHLIDNDSLKYLNGTVISDFNAEWPIGVKRSGTAHQYLSYLKKGEFIAENVEIISGRGLNLQHVGGRISIDKIFTLDSLSMTIHENEYLVNGTIDNLYNHLAHKDTLYSNLKISSKALNLSRYFEKSSVATDTREKPLFMFPSPMHLDAAINTGELIISKFIAS